MVVLLRVLQGSRLYGTNKPDSDYDYYEIVDKGKPYHRAHHPTEGDITRWPLSMFLRIADKGGHNALQILFARHEWFEVDLLKDFRESYRTNLWICQRRFLSVRDSYLKRNDAKGERYAAMFDRWLDQIAETGRFDPHNLGWEQRSVVYTGRYAEKE